MYAIRSYYAPFCVQIQGVLHVARGPDVEAPLDALAVRVLGRGEGRSAPGFHAEIAQRVGRYLPGRAREIV